MVNGVDAEALTEYLLAEVGDDLRSVVTYDRDDYDVAYARDDVRAKYSQRRIEKVVRDLEVESLSREIQEDLYVHGDLEATVRCFDGGIEMHFIAGQGEGVAVAVEPETFVAQRSFFGRCLETAGLR